MARELTEEQERALRAAAQRVVLQLDRGWAPEDVVAELRTTGFNDEGAAACVCRAPVGPP